MPSVLKDWVQALTLAEQGTLLTAVRGPDNVRKDHPIKLLIFCYRRAILHNAKPTPSGFMADKELMTPADAFALLGRIVQAPYAPPTSESLLKFFETQTDDLPHHYLMHLAHSAEVVGRRHPDLQVRQFWDEVYLTIVESFHMEPESEVDYKHRLRDRGKH